MHTLHVVGDSISQQYGPYLKQFLLGVLSYSRKEGMPGDPSEPNGSNGGDSSLVLRYLAACAERGWHWNVLLINCGLHDLRTHPGTGLKQVPLDRYEANLQQIIPLARRICGKVVWVRTTPVVDAIHNAASRSLSFLRFGQDAVAYNAVADRLLAAHEAPSIDLFTFTQNLGPEVYADHVHFTEPAQKLQAAFVAGALLALN